LNEKLEFRLLNEFQRDFPLEVAPYAELARRLNVTEDGVLTTLRQLHAQGVISRVGAVFSPRRIGASTLAALAVPAEQLDAVADQVSAYAEVNHNYERENTWNLWFVATAPNTAHLDRTIADIAATTGCPLIRLPLLEEFHIDLGFDLTGAAEPKITAPGKPQPDGIAALSPAEQKLMAALQDGLSLETRPYASLAARADMREAEVLHHLQMWLDTRLIKRFGVVVRHHELGYTANAMCVWDVPDEAASAIGRHLAEMPGVTLCYRRARHLPDWPYNLYCMVHGRERGEVKRLIAQINQRTGLTAKMYPHAVLFSLRRYKQRGAHYAASSGVEHV